MPVHFASFVCDYYRIDGAVAASNDSLFYSFRLDFICIPHNNNNIWNGHYSVLEYDFQ